jgi:hypothetical protein
MSPKTWLGAGTIASELRTASGASQPLIISVVPPQIDRTHLAAAGLNWRSALLGLVLIGTVASVALARSVDEQLAKGARERLVPHDRQQ